ncbi:Short-chain dehydrogenase/reductase tropE [Colletotrichum trifolii]|uniref:Short-chain dehydrogenase/reductase tropE n=1 Tax=Colletotrichum trifolii TaxID=5466 RepID=A0A4R8QAN8_COLTR|nr:Short-chain dehydrogenase/reductase tropE [Colletotrichum trifolii]
MNVEPLVLDITSDNSIKSAVDIVQAKFGHLDVLINNAAILLGRPEDSIRQRLTTVFDTNVFGTIAVTEAFIPLLRNSTKVKRIVFVSSGLGSLAIRADLSLQAKDYIEK